MCDLPTLQATATELAASWPLPLPPVTVCLSARLTRTAGTYRPPGTITLSRHFVAQHPAGAVLAVLRHEIAHHVVRHTAPPGVRPHGPEFRAVAARLDAPRYAPAFTAPRTVHLYLCPTCGWRWERGRRLARGRRASCARCAPRYDDRFRLVYVGRGVAPSPE